MRKHIHLGYGKCVHTKNIHLGHSHHHHKHHGFGILDNHLGMIRHGGVFRTMDGRVLGDGNKRKHSMGHKKIAPLKFMR